MTPTDSTPEAASAPPQTLDRVRALDAEDPLKRFRDMFLFPMTDRKQDLYFVGNSLGLQPKNTAAAVTAVLDQWHQLGVRGHFEGNPPWIDYPESLNDGMASIVGARPHEIVVMNTLTVNLHLMLATFFQPSGKRCKVLLEDHAFPSDHQAISSHLQVRGCEPKESMIIVQPEATTGLLSTDAVVDQIRQHRDVLALVMLPGLQYYTGQVLDMRRITEAAHEYEIPVGFDLAHAAGNIPLQLHDWNIDFACWCTYKYLNSGPGALGACFIHERHAEDTGRNRLAGWWGHERTSRFQMAPEFIPPPTAMGWQLSNPPILSLAATDASLRLFREAGGMEPLRKKSLQMNRFFRAELEKELGDRVRVVTPPEPDQHGCQLSLEIQHEGTSGRATYDQLELCSVRTDWREPNVIRAAPVPLYNTFTEIARFVQILKSCLNGAPRR